MNTTIVFFNGWGMDEQAIQHLSDNRQVISFAPQSPHQDILTSLDKQQQPIIVVAWSLGVWAANRFLTKHHNQLRIQQTIALNGTPIGIDEQTGIPSKIFAHTAETLDYQQRNKLYRRIFSCPSWHPDDYSTYLPKLSITTQRASLKWLLTTISASEASHYYDGWTQAWISEFDPIFPADNQYRYWQEKAVTIQRVPAPHHLLRQWSSWADFLSNCP